MSQPRHSVSVAAVITDNEGRVLVIKRRDNGAWQLPGVYQNLKLGVVALVFRAELTGGTLGPTEESAAADWWTTA